jgi:predicted PhzF superfamily epimerase YddE/YHI9
LSSATYRTYTYQGWRITAAFIDGKTVRILYAKGLKSGADTVPTAEEIAAVLTAEAGEGEWKEQARVTINPVKSFSNLFLKTKQWVHSRGPLACLRNGGKVLVIEIPNVQALKATSPAGKDAGRGNIPKF